MTKNFIMPLARILELRGLLFFVVVMKSFILCPSLHLSRDFVSRSQFSYPEARSMYSGFCRRLGSKNALDSYNTLHKSSAETLHSLGAVPGRDGLYVLDSDSTHTMRL